MKIDGFTLGRESPVYLIAEMSANHNGSIDNAKRTILAAKQSGANAIKIQTYTPDTLTIRSDRPEFQLKGGLWDGYQLYDLYQEAHTPFEWHRVLFDYAKECGITLFSTPFDESAVDLLEELNTPAYKIASFEIVDIPLIKRIARLKKPILMSTGAATLDEVAEAVRAARSCGAEDILIFHCISAYPAPLDEMQLRNISILKKEYGVLVGLSDHSIGSDAGFLSVALGIDAIEKHFMADPFSGGCDSQFSATPKEFNELRGRIDLARAMLGSPRFSRSKSEGQSSSIRRSIYSVMSKKTGETLEPGDIKIIRPGQGLHPRYFPSLIGAKLRKDLTYGEPLTEAHLEEGFLVNQKKSDDFFLQEIVPTPVQERLLFEQLKERKFNISHKRMPSLDEHRKFVTNHPYRVWWLIYDFVDPKRVLGTVYVNYDNSVGLHLAFEMINFSANHFMMKLKTYLSPELPKHSAIYYDFFYNVHPENWEFINWLKRSDYVQTQCSFAQINSSII
jgi:pseudaminic acid synthase